MTHHNSPEEISKRDNQEDPLVMYLIIRESLGMGVGKTAAQAAHASQMLQIKYEELNNYLDVKYDDLGSNAKVLLPNYNAQVSNCLLYHKWLNSSFRKVVLRASDKEWKRLKEFNHVLVTDSGLTEIAAGSETCIGLWPMLKSEAQKTMIKKLQALK